MIDQSPPARSWAALCVAAPLGLLAILASAGSAGAALGGSAATVEADRVHFAARMATAARADFTVHQLSAGSGAVIREYVNASDVVFAVSWRGAGRPDLQQLLGPSFETLQVDNAPAGGRRTRAPLRVQRAELRVSTGGHPGAFWGRALLPGAAPTDFTAAEFQ